MIILYKKIGLKKKQTVNDFDNPIYQNTTEDLWDEENRLYNK